MIAGSWTARLPLFLASCVPVRQIREVGARLAQGIFDDRAAVDERELGKLLAKVVGRQRTRMGSRRHREGFGPGEELVWTDQPFSFLLLLLREIPHTLGQLVGMRQKKGEVESTGCIQDLGRLFEIGSFTRIHSATCAEGEIKEQLGGAAGLPHSSPLPAHIP